MIIFNFLFEGFWEPSEPPQVVQGCKRSLLTLRGIEKPRSSLDNSRRELSADDSTKQNFQTILVYNKSVFCHP